MRMMIPALGLLALTSLSTAVEATPPCPFPMLKVCKREPMARPPRCHCENPPGSPPWGGKAEIHKKNVPTVKPTKSPGPND